MTVKFAFTETVATSFVLLGKRYTVEHPGIPAGTYKLVPTRKGTSHG